MSDFSEMVEEGILCQGCGVYIDEDDWDNAEDLAGDHPRWCLSCGGDPEYNGARKVDEEKK